MIIRGAGSACYYTLLNMYIKSVNMYSSFQEIIRVNKHQCTCIISLQLCCENDFRIKNI